MPGSGVEVLFEVVEQHQQPFPAGARSTALQFRAVIHPWVPQLLGEARVLGVAVEGVGEAVDRVVGFQAPTCSAISQPLLAAAG